MPGQKLLDALGRMIRQPSEHVGEPHLRIDVVELCRRYERVEGGGSPAAFVGAGEGPVAAPDGDGTQLALGGVVRHAETAVIEEAGQRRPALEMALPVSLFLNTLPRCSRNQVSNARISGQLRSVRTPTRRIGARPLISRSMANSTSICAQPPRWRSAPC